MQTAEQLRREKTNRFRDDRKDIEMLEGQRKVEEFWFKVINSLDTPKADTICEAYKRFIVGSEDYDAMTRVHSNKTPAKEDYQGFYGELTKREIINPSKEELELLTKEGFNSAGLIGIINDCRISTIASQIIVNMIGAMYS
ncbi:MAG: hypothetical protein KKB21_01705 [Nanoarchaeota archaeon]|nr:hypothetical protein [Nanoarchaeota archaeon]